MTLIKVIPYSPNQFRRILKQISQLPGLGYSYPQDQLLTLTSYMEGDAIGTDS